MSSSPVFAAGSPDWYPSGSTDSKVGGSVGSPVRPSENLAQSPMAISPQLPRRRTMARPLSPSRIPMGATATASVWPESSFVWPGSPNGGGYNSPPLGDGKYIPPPLPNQLLSQTSPATLPLLSNRTLINTSPNVLPNQLLANTSAANTPVSPHTVDQYEKVISLAELIEERGKIAGEIKFYRSIVKANATDEAGLIATKLLVLLLEREKQLQDEEFRRRVTTCVLEMVSSGNSDVDKCYDRAVAILRAPIKTIMVEYPGADKEISEEWSAYKHSLVVRGEEVPYFEYNGVIDRGFARHLELRKRLDAIHRLRVDGYGSE